MKHIHQQTHHLCYRSTSLKKETPQIKCCSNILFYYVSNKMQCYTVYFIWKLL
jgi:hypothetical protein